MSPFHKKEGQTWADGLNLRNVLLENGRANKKHGYQCIRPLLWFWEAHHFQVLWVTLSTAEGGRADKLTYHHKQLRQRIERHL